jgi:hypothetical protein
MGGLTGTDDPHARFLARAIHLFQGRIIEY